MYLRLAAAIDALYEDVVNRPAQFDDQRLAEWIAEQTADTSIAKPVAKELRRAMRMARKLRDKVPSDPDNDWRRTVDELVGVAAWRPALGIVQYGFEEGPNQELFEDLKVRLREVTFDRWMEGVDFDEWMAGTDQDT
ncbi:MAG: hypothetical protein HKN07_15630 [Acidimicrobiia bacterium]|nr:hypothetical protein [Acidimicrobiia bacterium]